MLQLENIVVEQGGFQLCADFEIPTGAQVAIIGPSGAGKSTLLDLIAGFIEPVKGRVLWNGKNLAGLPPGARPVSILFQDNNIFPHLTVAQNVGLGLKPNLRLSPQQQEDVGKSLRRVGLEEMAQRSPASLSGGQRSRVALARILLQNRPVLALDEPFGALGPSLKREMLDLVQSLAAEQMRCWRLLAFRCFTCPSSRIRIQTPKDDRAYCSLILAVHRSSACFINSPITGRSRLIRT